MRLTGSSHTTSVQGLPSSSRSSTWVSSSTSVMAGKPPILRRRAARRPEQPRVLLGDDAPQRRAGLASDGAHPLARGRGRPAPSSRGALQPLGARACGGAPPDRLPRAGGPSGAAAGRRLDPAHRPRTRPGLPRDGPHRPGRPPPAGAAPRRSARGPGPAVVVAGVASVIGQLLVPNPPAALVPFLLAVVLA